MPAAEQLTVTPVRTPAETPTEQAGIGGETPVTTPQQGPVTGTMKSQANVESIEVRVLESFPVQVHATAKGYLPDPCTSIDRVQQERSENTFNITITTTRPESAACTQVIVPFEQNITLNVAGLKAGTYVVRVNGIADGVNDTFTLQADNTLPPTP